MLQVDRQRRLLTCLLTRLPEIARICHADTDRCLARCWRCLGGLLPPNLLAALRRASQLSDSCHGELAMLAVSVLVDRKAPTPKERRDAMLEYVRWTSRLEAEALAADVAGGSAATPPVSAQLRHSLHKAFSRASAWRDVQHTDRGFGILDRIIPANDSRSTDEKSVTSTSRAVDLYRTYNAHDHVAMHMAIISGFHPETSTASLPSPDERELASGTSGAGAVPVWRAGAESLEAERGVVTSVLDMLPSLFGEEEQDVRAAAARMFVRHTYSDHTITSLKILTDPEHLKSVHAPQCSLVANWTYQQRCDAREASDASSEVSKQKTAAKSGEQHFKALGSDLGLQGPLQSSRGCAGVSFCCGERKTPGMKNSERATCVCCVGIVFEPSAPHTSHVSNQIPVALRRFNKT